MTVAKGDDAAEQTYLDSKFKVAALRGNVKQLAELRAKGADVNHADASTALINAVQAHNFECLEYLVTSCKAKVDVKNAKGETPLHYACFLGLTKMADFLINNKADIDALSGDKNTAYHYAMFSSDPEAVLDVLDGGYGGKIKTKADQVPVCFSLVCKHDKAKVLESLVKREKAVADFVDEGGNNLAHLVVRFSRERSLETLLEAMPELFDRANAQGQLPLHLAALSGSATMVRNILANRDKEKQMYAMDSRGRYAVHYAASSTRADALGALLEQGALVRVEDNEGVSPLTLASATGTVGNIKLLVDGSSKGHLEKHALSALLAAVHNQNEKAIKALLRSEVVVDSGLKGYVMSPDEAPFLLAGFYGSAAIIETMVQKFEGLLDQQDANGRTVLHICAAEGKWDALEYLCRVLHEEYLQISTKLGRNALWYAACGGHTKCVQLLMDSGVDTNKADNFDIAPLSAACKAGHIDTLKVLVQAGADINTKNTEGMTPLMQAAVSDQSQLVQVLLEQGADVNMPDKDGATALHHAAQAGRARMCAVLVKAGADLTASDRRMRSPLHAAVYYGRTIVATQLVRLGADIAAIDKAKHTCVTAAESVGHNELANILKQEKERSR